MEQPDRLVDQGGSQPADDADGQAAELFLVAVFGHGGDAVDAAQDLGAFLIDAFAAQGQGEMAAATKDQLAAKLFFQPLQGEADGRLAHVQALRRAGQAFFLGDQAECAQQVPVQIGKGRSIRHENVP